MRSMKDFSRSAAMPPASAMICSAKTENESSPTRNGGDSSLPSHLRTRTVGLWVTWIRWAGCGAGTGEALSPLLFPPRVLHVSEGYPPFRSGPDDLGHRL